MEKFCKTCGELKPLTAFSVDSSRKDERRYNCRVCDRTHQRKINLGRHRMTEERWQALLSKQGGGCALCPKYWTPEDSMYYWHVEHDHSCCPDVHSCGKCVRGITCAGCNRMVAGWEAGNQMPHLKAYLAGPR